MNEIILYPSGIDWLVKSVFLDIWGEELKNDLSNANKNNYSFFFILLQIKREV